MSLDDYKMFITSQFSQPEHLYKIAPKYRENFEFNVQDFNKRIDEIEDKGNSVIVLRNTLYQSYGDGYESQILISDLANKMKGGSLLVVGGYDMAHMPNLKKALRDYFVELQPNVWGLKDYKNITSIFKRMFNKLVNNKQVGCIVWYTDKFIKPTVLSSQIESQNTPTVEIKRLDNKIQK